MFSFPVPFIPVGSHTRGIKKSNNGLMIASLKCLSRKHFVVKFGSNRQKNGHNERVGLKCATKPGMLMGVIRAFSGINEDWRQR